MIANYNELLQVLITAALKEDIGEGDHSTLSSISPDAKGMAVLKIKEEGVLAGMNVAKAIFQFQQPDCIFKAFMKDTRILPKYKYAKMPPVSPHGLRALVWIMNILLFKVLELVWN